MVCSLQGEFLKGPWNTFPSNRRMAALVDDAFSWIPHHKNFAYLSGTSGVTESYHMFWMLSHKWIGNYKVWKGKLCGKVCGKAHAKLASMRVMTLGIFPCLFYKLTIISTSILQNTCIWRHSMVAALPTLCTRGNAQLVCWHTCSSLAKLQWFTFLFIFSFYSVTMYTSLYLIKHLQ